MASRRIVLGATLLACMATAAIPARADHDGSGAGGHYEVVITNLTRGQQFTPVLLATHKAGVRMFEPGAAASPALVALAENGDTAPMAALLRAQPGTGAVMSGNSLTGPGQSVTFTIDARSGFNQISLAAMLIPTNDGFFALNGVPGPTKPEQRTMFISPAYDAGSEFNDEDCANIPGPPDVCSGEGVSDPASDDEGFVHIHAGIHGITTQLEPATYDWRNPVASIRVKRVVGDH
jgi:hypothetical protein